MPKTIIVSNRLPIRIEADKEGEPVYRTSEGGLATALGSVYKENGNIWIGWPGKEIQDESTRATVTRFLVENHMRPVFLSQEELNEYYLGFSNQTLWPAFHYFVQYINYKAERWDYYCRVNQKFADEVIKYAEPEDIIWVHDYQLLLLPGLLRQRLPEASIGFFQHIPFPSYEVFRLLPWRNELLQGLLGSDYLGFHTYDDMRHFLSNVHRLTNYHYRANTVEVGERLVEVDALPMGIDYAKYYESAVAEETRAKVEEFRQGFGKQRFILSVDRLDYSKGIPDRLHAFNRFLAENPEYQGEVSLLLIVVPSRDKVPSYQSLKDQVDEMVGKINGRFATFNWRPIHYFYRSFPLTELSAFYRLSEVAMITPVRDGMNLVCKEFVASKFDKRGVLILSEMAGSAKELSEAILVNPKDQQGLVRALKQALEMDPIEQRHRLEIMQESLQKYDIFSWVKLFNDNFALVKEKQKELRSSFLRDETEAPLIEAYDAAEKRLIILDYDGTLVPFHNDPAMSVPDEELLHLLRGIAEQEKNELIIISGRPADFLDKHLGNLGLAMGAEHGIWLKERGGKWQLNVEMPDESWKNTARNVINFYVDRTPGSFLEEKENALVWHFRRVESGLASLRSSELSSHLRHVLAEKGLDIMEGHAVVEVKPAAINKGSIAHRYYKKINPDFAIALGDDKTDEYIFAALPSSVYSIKVGTGQTKARYSVSDYQQVRQLLAKLL